MRRTSTVMESITRKSEGPKAKVQAFCVACGKTVSPGFVYTGSVLMGMAHRTTRSIEGGECIGSIECLGHTHLICSPEREVVKKVGYFKRERGYICDGCVSNYHTVTDGSGKKHQIVETDPRPGFIGRTVIPTVETHIEVRR